MKEFDLKMFVCELAIYTVLVLAYFFLVLHFMGHWLKELFDHDRLTFATVSILLMIGQAVGLEAVASFLFGLIRPEKK